MKPTPDKDEMTPAMAFLVDKLKSGKANVGDIGIILADTYRQTDHQSKVLEEQTKSIKSLQDKVSELEPAVNSLVKDRNTAKWAIRGVVSFVSAFGLAVIGWVYTQGQSIAYALSLDTLLTRASHTELFLVIWDRWSFSVTTSSLMPYRCQKFNPCSDI